MKNPPQIMADIGMFLISHIFYEIRVKFDRILLICGGLSGLFHGCI